jgi:FtsP/CotA-like multicopper oxidase with cupredoxin domain
LGRPLTRRRAIRYGVGAATAVVTPELLAARSPAGTNGAAQASLAAATGRHEVRPPAVLRSHHGRLRVKLTCRPAVVDMGAPKPVRTYTYDGIVPGYTWELRGGDVLHVDLRNHLPELPPQPPMTMDRPHEWTTTNLHTHGLHVSPSGIADNVFLKIPPGHRQRFEIPIPDDHPAGIFWYHPHHHGAVTQQVRAGMAGLIIVRGDLDRVPEVRAATEKVLVLQSIELGNDYQLLDSIPDPSKQQAFFPRTNVLYTVNGKLTPKITMHSGEVQRWRLLNAAEGKYMSLKLQQHELHVLAWDGLTMPAPDPAELVMMSAGNRVEFLVKAGKPGTYELILTPGSSQKPNIPGMPASGPSPTTRATFLCKLGAPQLTPLWRDTFVLTKRSGDSLTFESNFDDFTGKFVEHCHVIAHEDLGMMGSVEVVR